MNPDHITDDAISMIADSSAICKYVDIPLQHINDDILVSMNRAIKKAQIISLIEKIRKNIPGVAIRTAFIVGFPGEGDKEFEELLEFLRQMRFERLGLFRYSREEGTPAHNMEGQVSEDVKSERFDAVMRLQQDVARSVNEKFLGRDIEVLIDEKAENEDGLFIGRSRYDAPEVDGEVYIKSSSAKVGDIINAKVIDTYEYDLVAEELKPRK